MLLGEKTVGPTEVVALGWRKVDLREQKYLVTDYILGTGRNGK